MQMLHWLSFQQCLLRNFKTYRFFWFLDILLYTDQISFHDYFLSMKEIWLIQNGKSKMLNGSSSFFNNKWRHHDAIFLLVLKIDNNNNNNNNIHLYCDFLLVIQSALKYE